MKLKFFIVTFFIICFSAKSNTISNEKLTGKVLTLVNQDHSVSVYLGNVLGPFSGAMNKELPAGYYRFYLAWVGGTSYEGSSSFPTGIAGPSGAYFYVPQGTYNIHYKYGHYNFVSVTNRMLIGTDYSVSIPQVGEEYRAENITLPEGYVRFLFADNGTYFGSTTFPSGELVLNGSSFNIPAGTYNVSINSDGTFAFTNALSNVDFKIKKVKIYPNPSDNYWNFSVANGNEIDLITIYNNIGQLVFSKSIQQQKDISIDASFFTSGVYYAHVSTVDEKEEIVRLVKK